MTTETKKVKKIVEGNLEADNNSLNVFYRDRTALEINVNKNNQIWGCVQDKLGFPMTETGSEVPFTCRSITEALQCLEQYAADAKFGVTARAQKAQYPKTCMAAMLIANHLDAVAKEIADRINKLNKPFETIERKEMNAYPQSHKSIWKHAEQR